MSAGRGINKGSAGAHRPATLEAPSFLLVMRCVIVVAAPSICEIRDSGRARKYCASQIYTYFRDQYDATRQDAGA